MAILHTDQDDLAVDLVAPNGTLFNLSNRTGSGTDNIVRRFTVNASAVAANGQWTLRVNDNGAGDTGAGDTGKIDRWSLPFRSKAAGCLGGSRSSVELIRRGRPAESRRAATSMQRYAGLARRHMTRLPLPSSTSSGVLSVFTVLPLPRKCTRL